MDDTKTEKSDATGSLAEERLNVAEYDRRQALAKMGKYAAYTAPTLLVLLSAKTSDAQGWDCVLNPAGNCVGRNCPPGGTASNNCGF